MLALAAAARRSVSASASAAHRVAVLGAAGGIGQPLAMLLKLNERVSHLSLYDIVRTPGVAADLSHISSPAQVVGYAGADQLGAALKGAQIVVIPAGVPRKPGMTRDDLFNVNATIVKNLAEACAKHCPDAHLLVISNPVNSTVPIVAETLKRAGVYNPKRLFGVTTLDVVRAQTFVAENQKMDVAKVSVPVIGGHAGTTILPLLSQVAGAKFSKDDIEKLTNRIQFGGDEVVKAKSGEGSATLSMAYAALRFTDSLMAAISGQKGIVECAFVENTVVPNTPFFALPVELGKNGVERVHGYGILSAYEQQGFNAMLPDLQKQIAKGIEFAKTK